MRFKREALALVLVLSGDVSFLNAFLVPPGTTPSYRMTPLFAGVDEASTKSDSSPPSQRRNSKPPGSRRKLQVNGESSSRHRRSSIGNKRTNNAHTHNDNSIPKNARKLSEVLKSATLQDFCGETDSERRARLEHETQKEKNNAVDYGVTQEDVPVTIHHESKVSKQLQNRNGYSKYTNDRGEEQQREEHSLDEPWKARYMVSKRTQRRIQMAAKIRSASSTARAIAVLEALLDTEPERCNEVNVLCALTLSAKVLGSSPRGHGHGYLQSLLMETLDVLHELVLDDRLDARQLCNAVWAIAKHYNRDATILPPPPQKTAMSTDTAMGVAETWVLQNETQQSAEKRVGETVDAIAKQLTSILSSPERNNPKVGEIAMATWAYGVLRPRRLPPGWAVPPRIGRVPQTPSRQSGVEYITFEQWSSDDSEKDEGSRGCADVTDEFFDAVGETLCHDVVSSDEAQFSDSSFVEQECSIICSNAMVRDFEWHELANVVWAYASHGHCSTPASQHAVVALASEAIERLQEGGAATERMLSRDVAQIVWALGTLQSDNFRLGDTLVHLIDAMSSHYLTPHEKETTADFSRDLYLHRPFEHWSCPDLVQLAISMAHGRVDNLPLLDSLYTEARARLHETVLDTPRDHRMFYNWELSVLLWAQARLYLRSSQGDIFDDFAEAAVKRLAESLKNEVTLKKMRIGQKEQANIAWSLSVLELYDSEGASELLRAIFRDVAAESEHNSAIQLEHAHQLWQCLFLLEEARPDIVEDVPRWFRDFLKEKWTIEKSRIKRSSARHRSLSDTLTLMGVTHYNEHDEDIDVAIVLKDDASWTNAARKSDHNNAKFKVAVEFDGPMHFTRPPVVSDEGSTPVSIQPPRTLGHTVLKYRLLKRQGWTVVRVPYYEFDKIPFWASMERQRYLQRLLKTHANIRFSAVDVSEYKAIVPSRASRFD